MSTEEGWREWALEGPPRGVLLQVTRSGWEKVMIAREKDIDPMANAVGLYWKLTGIARQDSD